MEIGTDTTARIAADILIAALESKAVTTRGDTKECVHMLYAGFLLGCMLLALFGILLIHIAHDVF